MRRYRMESVPRATSPMQASTFGLQPDDWLGLISERFELGFRFAIRVGLGSVL